MLCIRVADCRRIRSGWVSPRSAKKLHTPTRPDSLCTGDTARLIERRARSSKRDCAPIWEEATAQVGRGLLAKPEIVTDAGRIARSPSAAANLAFRCGARLLDKMRDLEDLKRDRTNSARPILAPNSFSTWGHIAQLAIKGAKVRHIWAFPKEDRVSAYKWSPYYQIALNSIR